MLVDNMLEFYRDSPWIVKLHVNVRWRLLPFQDLAAYLPEQGRLVDIGCGYGLWPFYSHILKPKMEIWALEPDQRKIQIAIEIIEKRAIKQMNFFTAKAQTSVFPSFNVASIIDVLYLIPWEEQIKVLKILASKMELDGKLLIKEMNDRPTWKYAWNLIEEWLVVRVMKITRGDRFYFRTVDGWQRLLSSLGLSVEVVRLDKGYIHPHVLFVCQREQ